VPRSKMSAAIPQLPPNTPSLRGAQFKKESTGAVLPLPLQSSCDL